MEQVPGLIHINTWMGAENKIRIRVLRLFYLTLSIDKMQIKFVSKWAHLHGVYHLSVGTQHALPDPGQIPQVEDVVELGRGRQHLHFGRLPQTAGQGHQLWHRPLNISGKSPAGAEVALTNHPCTAVSGATNVKHCIEKLNSKRKCDKRWEWSTSHSKLSSQSYYLDGWHEVGLGTHQISCQ